MTESAAFIRRVFRAWQRKSFSSFLSLVGYNLGLLLRGKYAAENEAFNRSFDRRCRVDTAGTEAVEYLTADAALKTQARRYEPVSVNHMRTLIESLPQELDGFDFVDLGSGKGRALFVAAEFPFRLCIGVEFAQELHAIAVRNIATYQNARRRCPEIRSIHADASKFEFPMNPFVCFLNNPFNETLIGAVAQHIHESIRSAPRPCFIIYLHANHPKPFDSLEGWVRLTESSFGRSPYIIWGRNGSHPELVVQPRRKEGPESELNEDDALPVVEG